MPRNRRRLLAVLLVLVAGAGLVVLSLVEEETTTPPAPPPPLTVLPPYRPSPPPPPPVAPPPPLLPAELDVRDLAVTVGAADPGLAETAEATLLWFFDRLAEAVGQAEGRFTPDSREPTPETAVAVVEALATLGPKAEDALVAALTTRVSKPGDPDAAGAAVAALSADAATSVADLATYYAHAGDPTLRHGLVRAVAGMRRSSEVELAFLVRATLDPQPAVREAALEGLGALGEDAAPTTDDVVGRLEDGRRNVRRRAAAALVRIAGPDERALAVVRRDLGSVDPTDRWHGVRLLLEMGTEGRSVWPELLGLLGDPKPVPIVNPRNTEQPDRVSWVVSDAFVALGARALMPRLRDVVGTGDERARVAAALALLGLGEDPAEVGDALVDALRMEEDSNWLMRTRLARVTDGRVPEHVRPDLVDAVAAQLRWLYGPDAARALLHLGDAGRERVRAVLMGEGTEYERHSILGAFQEDATLAAGLEPELEHVAAKDANSWNRKTAAKVVAALEGADPAD